MKRTFSVYRTQALVALSVTIVSGVYAGEYDIDCSGQYINTDEASMIIPDENISLGGGGSIILPGGSNSAAGGSNSPSLDLGDNGNISIGGGSSGNIGSLTIRTLLIHDSNINIDNMIGINGISYNTFIIDNSNAVANKHVEINENIGRMILRNDAVLQSQGLSMAQNAGSTLELINSTLSQSKYNVAIAAGNTLSAGGASILTANSLQMAEGSNLKLTVNAVTNGVNDAAVLTTTGGLDMNGITLDLQGTEYLSDGLYKILTCTEGSIPDISNWTINGAADSQLRWLNGTLYYNGGYDWNHAVSNAKDIDDLREILGNLIVNGGDITLEAFVKTLQDAGLTQGHIVINRGGIHITGSGNLDGNIIFNGNLKELRKLFIEKDLVGMKIDLNGGSENENNVSVSSGKRMEVTELSGAGGMSKSGEGEMIILGNGHEVGETLAVEEGQLTFAVEAVPTEAQNDSATRIHELAVGNDDGKRTMVNIEQNAMVEGEKMLIDGSQAYVSNQGSLIFSEEVTMTKGHLDNQGSISKVTMEGGKVSGSGSFAGLKMLGGELVVGNSPGLQTYTEAVDISNGTVTFSLANADTAATNEIHGWSAEAYSTIDMRGNALTLGGDVRFVLEIGGSALATLVAAEGTTLTFNLNLIQNIATDSLTLNQETLTNLLNNTSIIITHDAAGLTENTIALAGKDITAMLSDASYAYIGNSLTFSGTLTYDSNRIIPEPTTVTLSLLALTALAARRRKN